MQIRLIIDVLYLYNSVHFPDAINTIQQPATNSRIKWNFDGKFCANVDFSWIIYLEHFVVDERWIVFIVNVMN